MDPTTIITLTVSGVIGLLANYLFDAIKRWIAHSKTQDILIKTKEGETIKVTVDKNMSVDEIDSKVIAAIGKEDSSEQKK